MDIKKATLLVGGNSAGKTSFLAAFRFMCDFFSDAPSASFNKTPFFLGSFEEMAHYRGGRYGRSPCFYFDIMENINPSVVLERLNQRYRTSIGSHILDIIPSSFRITLKFEGYRNQPVISSFIFSAGRFSFEVTNDGGALRNVKLPSSSLPIVEDEIGSSESVIDPRFIDYYLMNASYVIRQQKRELATGDTDDTATNEIRLLSSIFQTAREILSVNVHAFAPVRTEPQRVYNPSDTTSNSEGEQAPLILAQLNAFEAEKWKGLKHSLEQFGSNSGLFSKIDVKHLSRQKTGPFQITVSVGKTKSPIIDVGYGISQALPIALELLQREDATTFLMQQPEVHLHPKGQAELASFIGSQIALQGHSALIETHSDYIIDRFRMDIRDRSGLKPDDFNIIYVRRGELDTDLHQISVDESGNITGAPARYREFFLRETARSLGLS